MKKSDGDENKMKEAKAKAAKAKAAMRRHSLRALKRECRRTLLFLLVSIVLVGLLYQLAQFCKPA